MEGIEMRLSSDEALVLFEWLTHYNERSTSTDFQDQSEQRALWNLEANLESVLPEPLSKDYRVALEAARDRLRDASD